MSELSDMREQLQNKIRGSFWGGAIGDALGYPVEFLSERQIFDKYGEKGITEYSLDPEKELALISDDTQMTLFTANGILYGDVRMTLKGNDGPVRDYVALAYKDWLMTQEITFGEFTRKMEKLSYISWLSEVSGLYSLRAPGGTCLSALRSSIHPSIKHPVNNSKGCGGIMRVAPLGLYYDKNIAELDYEGAEIAAITHGHSLGYMPAAVLTHILNRIVYGNPKSSLKDIIFEAKETVNHIFEGDMHLGELNACIDNAVALSENNAPDTVNIAKLGEGWVAEETLAIAIYCSLKYQKDFSSGVIAAVNHNGDSDSTGAVTGNILGALIGFEAIEDKWKEALELKEVIDIIAADLCNGSAAAVKPSYRDQYLMGKHLRFS